MAETESIFEETDVGPGKVVSSSKFGAGESRYLIKMDSLQKNVEANYFWITRFLSGKSPYGRDYFGEKGTILKIKDIYSSGETSSFWGSVEQRKGAQIDKFQQLMANIGSMLKTLFQLLRELRIMEERLDYYERSEKGEDAAEVALKSIWIDLVEGGARNPGSVTGLAAQVGFITLPDLFYSIHPKKVDEVEKDVDRLKESGLNRKVREVLARKLKQFLIWKEKTYKELKTGNTFKLKYLRQHFHVIRLYLNWLRPYLKNIQRLQQQGDVTDKDLIASFETSKIELEVLGVKRKYEVDMPNTYGGQNMEEREFKETFPCVRVKIEFVAIPEMAYQQEFQRGAIHRGRSVITIEARTAKMKDILDYKKKLFEEDVELLKAVDESIDAMKEDIEHFLEKAGEIEEEEKKKESFFEPFKGIFGGLKDLFKHIPSFKITGDKVPSGEAGSASNIAKIDAYLLYKVFKQTHGMLTE